MHTIVETHAFRRSAEDNGMSEDERHRLYCLLSEDPTAGEIMPDTGGARKLRFAKPGGGKSGGYRIITYYAGKDVPVFLMDVYAKGEKINLTQSEKNELKRILGTIAADWQKTMSDKVKEMKKVENG